MSEITQTISPLSTPPSRSDPENFDDRADQFLSELPDLQSEINTWAGQCNDVADEVSANALTASTAIAAANFAGQWSDLTGALSVPASVYHSEGYWMLLEDLADVTSSQPGLGSEWVGISIHSFFETVEGNGHVIKNVRWQDTAEVAQDIGDISGATAINISLGGMIAATVAGDVTLTLTNWPEAGSFGEAVLELTNGGSHEITWPTINWILQDGMTTTVATEAGFMLQEAGVDFVYLWTRDGGTTIYGRVVR
jgi:hypothetical protein